MNINQTQLTPAQKDVFAKVVRARSITTKSLAESRGLSERATGDHLTALKTLGLIASKRVKNANYWFPVGLEELIAQLWQEDAKLYKKRLRKEHPHSVPPGWKMTANRQGADAEMKKAAQERRQRVKRIIDRNPGITRNDIGKILDDTRTNVSNAIGWLRARNHLHSVAVQRGHRYYPGPKPERVKP